MRRSFRSFFSAAAAFLVVFSAVAQDTINPKTKGPGPADAGLRNARRAKQLNNAAKASEVLGATVLGAHDEKIGKVEDLAIDVESGRIVQVILATSGFLNIGDTLRAVPPGLLRYDAANKIVHFNADKETLAVTPRFRMANWAEDSDSNHLAAVYRQYGEEPAFNFMQKTDGAGNRQGGSNENQCMIPESRLANLQQAHKLMGFPVKNLQVENLGKVENLLLDMRSGRVVAVVISSGGYLGRGDELSAVPPTALRFTPNRETLQLDSSKEMLANAPHFRNGQWPDFAQPVCAAGIYRAYKLKPYFTTNAIPLADNTAGNLEH